MSVTESHETLDLVTKAEAAELLRVSPRTIDRYADAHKIPRLKTHNGRVRFHRADVLALDIVSEQGAAS